MPRGIYPRTEHHRRVLSQNSKKKLGRKHTPEARRKISESAKRGPDHPWWQGGKTAKTEALRNSVEYKIWRRAVYERDGFKCIWCGGGAGTLEADHIKPICNFPELVYEVSNGRTLCKSCHRKHTNEQLQQGVITKNRVR